MLKLKNAVIMDVVNWNVTQVETTVGSDIELKMVGKRFWTSSIVAIATNGQIVTKQPDMTPTS